MAEKYYAEKKYINAQQLFESVIQFVKGTPRYEELYLMYANSYYYDKDYDNAENIYKTILNSSDVKSYEEVKEILLAPEKLLAVNTVFEVIN